MEFIPTGRSASGGKGNPHVAGAPAGRTMNEHGGSAMSSALSAPAVIPTTNAPPERIKRSGCREVLMSDPHFFASAPPESHTRSRTTRSSYRPGLQDPKSMPRSGPPTNPSWFRSASACAGVLDPHAWSRIGPAHQPWTPTTIAPAPPPHPTLASEHHLQLGNEARVVVKACKAKTARDVADAVDVAATKGDHAL